MPFGTTEAPHLGTVPGVQGGLYSRVPARTHVERRLPKSYRTQPSTHSPSPPSSESLHALKPSFHRGVTPGCELACTHLHPPTLPYTEASWTASTLASKAFWQTSGSTPRVLACKHRCTRGPSLRRNGAKAAENPFSPLVVRVAASSE